MTLDELYRRRQTETRCRRDADRLRGALGQLDARLTEEAGVADPAAATALRAELEAAVAAAVAADRRAWRRWEKRFGQKVLDEEA